MKRLLAICLLLAATTAMAQEPDYSQWNTLLHRYYDPARGMDYGRLKERDAAALQSIRQTLGRVNVAALTRKQQLAYWINVYNVNVVATVVEAYPVKSIRDISTDPIVRLNVFRKPRVPFGGATLSLDDVENGKLRDAFHDPRIHFAINCAARSCPPLRAEAYVGERIDAQLDEQARKFLAGARVDRDGLHVSKIFDWFSRDFDAWGGGRVQFI